MIIDNGIFFAEVERLLAQGQEVTITVKGMSMRPLLRDSRDRVVLRSAVAEDITKGSVVLFHYKGSHILHRIKRIEAEKITFAGDGNYKIIEQASADAVIGVAIAVIRPSERRVNTRSLRWRVASAIWLGLPAFARRCILGVMRRL